MKTLQTPNVSKRSIKPQGIVIHHSDGSFKGTVSWCLNPRSEVSYHVVVDTNGDMVQLAKDTQRAWHAGRSEWNGKKDCNSWMLGIAVTGDTNSRELADDEIEVVAQWCVKKMIEHSISMANVVSHEMIAPNRKTDVSEKAYNQIMTRIRVVLGLDC